MKLILQNSKKYFFAISIIAIYVLIGKVAGVFKDVVLASNYGVEPLLDGYIFILTIALMPIGVWLSALSTTLVPLDAELSGHFKLDRERFYSELVGLTLIAGILVSLIMFTFTPVLINSGYLNINPELKSMSFKFIGWFSLLPIIGMYIGLLNTMLLAKNKHANLIYEAIPALSIVFFILIFTTSDFEPLVFGTIVGFALQMLALIMTQRWHGELFSPKFSFHSPHWKTFRKGLGLMLIVQAVMSLEIFIDQLFASSLSVGSISTLSYVSRIMLLILGVCSIVINRKAFPALSMSYVNSGRVKTLQLAIKWSLYAVVWGFSFTVLIWLFGREILDIVYVRGKFTNADADSVMLLLKFSIFQLPFYFGLLVLSAFFASARAYYYYVLAVIIFIMVKIITAFLFIDKFQLIVLPISSVIGYGISYLLLLYFLKSEKV